MGLSGNARASAHPGYSIPDSGSFSSMANRAARHAGSMGQRHRIARVPVRTLCHVRAAATQKAGSVGRARALAGCKRGSWRLVTGAPQRPHSHEPSRATAVAGEQVRYKVVLRFLGIRGGQRALSNHNVFVAVFHGSHFFRCFGLPVPNKGGGR